MVLSKLRPPRQRAGTIARQGAVALLVDAVAEVPVTVVTAPPGYGKTTLLAEASSRLVGFDRAWLRLDPDDGSPERLVGSIVVALADQDPVSVAEAHVLIGEGGTSPSELGTVIDLLVDGLERHRSRFLVLFVDDVHVLGGTPAQNNLGRLIDRLPPQLRLVLCGRDASGLPVARWRANGVVRELDAEVVGFSPHETDRYVNGVRGLGLSAEAVRRLHQRAVGWPAGISLLAETLAGVSKAARDLYVDGLSRIDPAVFQYLSQEVIEELPATDRDFLLAVSVLAVMTPTVCARITGRDEAAAILDRLSRQNLFMSMLEGDEPTYRLHDLFRQALQERLLHAGCRRLREAHRRAAAAVDDPAESLRHLVAAEAWTEAAELLVTDGVDLIHGGLRTVVRRVVENLPDEIRRSHPRLDLLLGREAWLRWDLDQARAHLERAVRDLAAACDDEGRGDALVLLTHVLHTAGLRTEALETMEAARRCPLTSSTRLRLHAQDAWFALGQGCPDQVLESLDAALELTESLGTVEAVRNLADTLHCHFIGIPGVIDRIERFGRVATPFMDDRDTPLRASVLGLMSWVHEWRGRSALAEAVAQEAIAISDRFGDLPWVVLDTGYGHATCLAMAGRHEEAEVPTARILTLLDRPDLVPLTAAWISVYLLGVGRVRLLQGKIDQARAMERRMASEATSVEWPMAPMARALMRALRAMAEASWSEAQEAAEEAVERQRRIRIFGFCDDARLVLARLHLDRGRAAAAMDSLAPALEENRRCGTPGGILWHGRAILEPLLREAWERGIEREFVAGLLGSLDADPGRPPARARGIRVPATGETLSVRELEVLRLVARGDSNVDIADGLFLSVHTVKRHVANLLRKLDARSRAGAVAVGRDLGVV
jgi:LuxR family maltose regulon positive regulatory protein